MSEKNDLLEQAKHNKELCLHIRSLKIYNDWVATTAFYAALHYVKFKIFPFKEFDKGKTIEFECYDDYIEYYYSDTALKSPSLHNILIHLVMEKLPKIKREYRFLRDKSHNARYNMYKIDDILCDEIIQKINKIESHCK